MIRAALVVALAATSSCGAGEAAESPQIHPPGTAFAINGLAVPIEEVDAAARRVQPVEPTAVFDQHRRYALGGLVIPRAVCRTRFGPEREQALAQATARLAYQRGELEVLPAGPLPGPAAPPIPVRGDILELDPYLWGPASELEVGEWSEPLELVGRFVLVRLTGRDVGEHEGQDVLALDFLEYPYVPAETTSADLRAWTDASRLEIVDPAWQDLVSLDFKSLMRGTP